VSFKKWNESGRLKDRRVKTMTLIPTPFPRRRLQKERAVGGPGKQKWLPGLWPSNGETSQAAAARSEPGDGRKEERKEDAPGLMEKIVSDENAALLCWP
jgi:hypothetical protein